MNERTKSGLARSTLYGMSIISIGAICFALGYFSGWRDRAQKYNVPDSSAVHSRRQMSEKTDFPRVNPTQRERTHLPADHPPLPMVDQHGHPSFDCRDVQRPLEKTDKDLDLASLFKQRKAFKDQLVSIQALVVGVYPNILKRNWFHLCDVPTGQVLVISSEQQAPIGSIITAQGRLKVDYDLKGIYRFPLFIEDALISGDHVRSPSVTPEGVVEL